MATGEKREYVISDDTMNKFKALPWKGIETAFGIKPDDILNIKDDKRKKQIVEALAYGRFTPAMNLRIPIPGTAKSAYVTSSLRVFKKEDNSYDLELSTHRPAIKNDQEKVYLYGEQIPQSAVHALRLTGQAGELILVPRKDGSGVMEKIVSVNPATNELISCDASLPKAILESEKFKGIYGVMPDAKQKAYLMRHKEVVMEGLNIPGFDTPQTRTIQFDVYSSNFVALQHSLRGAERDEFRQQKIEKEVKKEQEQEKAMRQARAQERQRGVQQPVQEQVNEQDMDMPADLEERF